MFYSTQINPSGIKKNKAFHRASADYADKPQWNKKEKSIPQGKH